MSKKYGNPRWNNLTDKQKDGDEVLSLAVSRIGAKMHWTVHPYGPLTPPIPLNYCFISCIISYKIWHPNHGYIFKSLHEHQFIYIFYSIERHYAILLFIHRAVLFSANRKWSRESFLQFNFIVISTF